MPSPRAVVVPIGELRVSSDRDEVLATCAGSCVAVALLDPVAAVAGLLHVVLPNAGPWPRAGYPGTYYADSGIGLLVDELIGRGARRENLVASLAGGASSLSGVDAEDSVGARNVRRVLEVLREQGIPVRSQDVGGREGRRVALAVATGEVHVTPTRGPCVGLPEPAAAPAPGQLRALAEAMVALGPNPAAAGALLAEVHRPAVDWAVTGEVVARDVVLALHVLRLANSSAYGRPREVSSFESALELLGPAQLRRICVVAATARNAERSLTDVRGLEPVLRHHCQASALISRRLAARCPASFRHDAFAACLLHGVGEIASRVAAATRPPDQAPQADAPGPELAALLLSWWRFPERMVAAARLHGGAEGSEGGEPSLASISAAACALAHLAGIPCLGDPLEPPDFRLARQGPQGGLREILQDLQRARLLDDA